MLGPPTAGKSTIVRALIKGGIAHGRRTGDIPLEWRAFADKILTPCATRSYLKNPDSRYYKKPLLRLQHKTLDALAWAYNGDIADRPYIYDELVAQYGLSLAIRTRSDCAWYFEEMPLPGLLVVLSASRDVLLERNVQRGHSNRPKKTISCLNRLSSIIRILNRRDCNMLKFDTGEKPIESIVREITEAVKCQN